MFKYKFLFVDCDTLGIKVARDEKMHAHAVSEEFSLIWQDPCFEGFLLQHLEGCSELKPSTCTDANNLLTDKLASYKKGLSAHELENFISLDGVSRAGSKNPGLKCLLDMIGL